METMETIQSIKDKYAFIVGYDNWESLVFKMITNFSPEKACESILEHEKQAEIVLQNVLLSKVFDEITEKKELLSIEQRELYNLIKNKENIFK